MTKALVEKGYDVYPILRPGSKHNDRLIGLGERIFPVELDCTEFNQISSKIEVDCDIFYHLAWFGGRDDFEGQNANIAYTIDALEAAAALNCKRFIGIGSQAEYGVVSGLISEDIMPSPVNAYGAAKVAAMYLTKRRAEQLGIEWVWGRIFSLYGDYEPSGRMLPDLLKKLASNEEVNLSNCEQNWDYLHVRDAADVIIAIGEKGRVGEIYNIANGDYKPLKDFVEEAKATLESSSKINYGDRPNPFISLQPDMSKTKSHTGWAPRIGFEEGIKAFVETTIQ